MEANVEDTEERRRRQNILKTGERSCNPCKFSKGATRKLRMWPEIVADVEIRIVGGGGNVPTTTKLVDRAK